MTVQCADGDSEVTITAAGALRIVITPARSVLPAEPVIFEDAPEDEAEAYSSDNDDDQVRGSGL